MSVFLSNVALNKWEKQDRTNPSNYDYQDKYQFHSSERNQDFVQEKINGDMGHICRFILEHLKPMTVHLTTVVLNGQIEWGYQPLQTSRHPISWRHFHRFGPSAVYNLHKIGTKMFEICAEM